MNTINWKLIFQLSIFGLLMAIATISLIPQNTEPFFWLAIFIVCAYLVAKKAPGKYFLHGFLTSIVNSIWITAAHILFAATYLPNHPQMQEMTASMPLFAQHHQRILMAILGLPFGAVFGLVLGLFCFVASKMIKK
ncbi:MAG TPA: hypothetical protein VKR53_06135 [Puia sp.]|nr:hypothetical protein [Puia sp.]